MDSSLADTVLETQLALTEISTALAALERRGDADAVDAMQIMARRVARTARIARAAVAAPDVVLVPMRELRPEQIPVDFMQTLEYAQSLAAAWPPSARAPWARIIEDGLATTLASPLPEDPRWEMARRAADAKIRSEAGAGEDQRSADILVNLIAQSGPVAAWTTFLAVLFQSHQDVFGRAPDPALSNVGDE